MGVLREQLAWLSCVRLMGVCTPRGLMFACVYLYSIYSQDGGGSIDFVEFVHMLHHATSPALQRIRDALEVGGCTLRVLFVYVCARRGGAIET